MILKDYNYKNQKGGGTFIYYYEILNILHRLLIGCLCEYIMYHPMNLLIIIIENVKRAFFNPKYESLKYSDK